MNVGLNLKNSRTINAPSWLIWELLTEFLDWPRWRKYCYRTKGQARALEQNSQFGFMLKPFRLPFWVKATITHFQPNKSLGWSGKFWGATNKTLINLKPSGVNKTDLHLSEDLSGLGLLIFSIFCSAEKVSKLHSTFLEDLASEAEKRAQRLDFSTNRDDPVFFS